jgi:hypothetical protein
MHRNLGVGVAMAATLALAGPAAANEQVRWTSAHEISNTFSCGVVEHTTAAIDGIASFDAHGDWERDVLRFSYDASYTDPATGRTIGNSTRQVVLANPATISWVGQGLFVRAPGGVTLLDVRRLVIDQADGSTAFRSAKSLAFDDPTVFERYDTAICGLF